MAKIIHKASEFQPDFGIPWTPVLSEERLRQMTVEQLQRYRDARKYVERRNEENPVGAGWTLPIWPKVMANWKKANFHVVLGGNQSGKTTLGARMTVWAAATIPEAEVYCFHVSEKRSIDDQQRFVYESLPNTIKAIQTKKGIHHSLQYSQKNGFTDSVCILPPHPGHYRGGSINFYNYQQYQQNDQIIEGIKSHFVWSDEKIPLALLETLKYRLFTYHGRLLLTYTVIDGWNDTIEKILAKTKTIEKVWCDDPRINGYVPVVQESLSMESTMIYYAHTADNPFTDYKEFLRLNKNADKATFLARGFGVPTKSIAGVFPGFNKEINVIEHDKLPFIKNPEYPVTRYMAIDPGGSKSWFMLWIAVDARGCWWVYREFPDDDDWALPGNKPGPAQKGRKFGVKDYVDTIKTAEGEEKIFERYIDPRMGAAETQSKDDGARTIISDLDDLDMTVIPASGVDIENGLQLINNQLAWDDKRPLDSVNAPRLMVSDRCQNFIYAMSEYTAKLGQTEACKDPCDAARYMAVSDIQFMDAKADSKAQRSTGVY